MSEAIGGVEQAIEVALALLNENHVIYFLAHVDDNVVWLVNVHVKIADTLVDEMLRSLVT